LRVGFEPTPTIHPQVNLVPHIFHKGHIHGFALPD